MGIALPVTRHIEAPFRSNIMESNAADRAAMKTCWDKISAESKWLG